MSKPEVLRARFYVELAVGAGALLLFAITLVWKDWIELGFKIDPDAGNGSAEFAICFVLLATTALSWWLARTERRRMRVFARERTR